MVEIHPQFLTDSAGKKLVVLSQSEFDTILEEQEDLDDVRLFDEAKKIDDVERITLEDYLKTRKAKDA